MLDRLQKPSNPSMVSVSLSLSLTLTESVSQQNQNLYVSLAPHHCEAGAFVGKPCLVSVGLSIHPCVYLSFPPPFEMKLSDSQ